MRIKVRFHIAALPACYRRVRLVLGVGLEPTGDFSAALQEQCNRRYANPAISLPTFNTLYTVLIRVS